MTQQSSENRTSLSCNLIRDNTGLSIVQSRHSHINIVPLHDAAEVFVSGKDSVETVVVDVRYNHLEDKRTEKHIVKLMWFHI